MFECRDYQYKYKSVLPYYTVAYYAKRLEVTQYVYILSLAQLYPFFSKCTILDNWFVQLIKCI